MHLGLLRSISKGKDLLKQRITLEERPGIQAFLQRKSNNQATCDERRVAE